MRGLTIIVFLGFLISSCKQHSARTEDEHKVQPISRQGGKEGGGGVIGSHAENPWFLQNTKKVGYCFDIDQTNFGVDIETIREKIGKVLGFWKSQFAMINADDSEEGLVKLGTQEFYEAKCSESHDITFLLGILNDEQRALLDLPPQKIIGKTAMTSYDEVNLRAKGFIYISPEKGPLKVEAANIVPNRWQKDGGHLLEVVLAHEIGHIFLGRRHLEEGLMSAEFTQQVVAYGMGSYNTSFFFPPSEKTTEFTYQGSIFFAPAYYPNKVGIDKKEKYAQVRITPYSKKDLLIYAAVSAGGPWRLASTWEWRSSTTSRNCCWSKVYVTEKQKAIALDGDLTISQYNPIEGYLGVYLTGEAKTEAEYALKGDNGEVLELKYTPSEMNGDLSFGRFSLSTVFIKN